ncbi:MAG TPA: DNA ligase D, partial [Ramlibacter sp.]|nr:DNA ligase D [Ramlibacter sp.]
RLELDGTMKSWAVPKGPSLDPLDKRMAAPTEDHPIAYNSFEGTIPKGNYGAGEVIVWDKGSWRPIGDPHEGLRTGKLKFELRGHKLRGHWTLVRMKGRGNGREDPWLLIKERDEVARPAAEYSITDAMPESVSALPDAPDADTDIDTADADTQLRAAAPVDGPPPGATPAELPAALAPQLAVLADGPPGHPDDWLYEIKFDGYRMLARVEAGTPRLFTRNGNDWTRRMPELARTLEAMDLPDGWYDGEIILPGEDAPADFQALQGAFDTKRTADIVYYLFDLPYCAGHDLRAVALEHRREVLQRIALRKPQPKVRFSEVFDGAPDQIVASACRLGLEGVIAKRRGSPYVHQRSASWLKLKCGERQEFVIAGYTDPKGSRAGIGALLLAVHGPDGELRYAGNVGTGFSQRALLDLSRQLKGLAAPRSPFSSATKVAGKPHWVRPKLIAEIAFAEWTRDGRVRQAVFHGLRSDKPPREITREDPLDAARVDDAAASKLPASLRLTHPDRVIDESTGITKLDIARYYAQVAALMMPHLQDRPVALTRAPTGLDGELFFQKHAERYNMAGIEPQDPKLSPGHASMLVVARPEGLMSAAQMNVIEFHTWNAVTRRIGAPDRMTFDLDPGEGVQWPAVQEAASLVRTLLEQLLLPAFLKTSGGKGLHVVVPLKPEFGWDVVKAFSQAVVQHLARAVPQRFVAKSGPSNRIGKIFIDYLRNGFGATTVSAWSARARPGMGISVPVRWDELQGLSGGDHWTVRSAAERLPKGNLPWVDYETSRAALQGAMQALEFTPPKDAKR